MSSSTLKELFNIIMTTTGDLDELGAGETVEGAAAGMGGRVTNFLNLTVSDLEKRTNWPALRFDVAGTSDGIEDTYEFIGTEDLRVGGNIDCWIAGVGRLEEVTAEQFDKLKAEGGTAAGKPVYYQRRVSTSGVLQVQLYPLPEAGYEINASGFQKATRFDVTEDDGVTEFDNALLVYGVLMQLDMYDGLQRGYGLMFKNQIDSTIMELMANRSYRIETESYA